MADFITAIRDAYAYDGYVAARPTGLVVRPGRGGCLYRHHGNHLTTYAVNVRDVVAQDWFVGTEENVFTALLKAMQPAAEEGE